MAKIGRPARDMSPAVATVLTVAPGRRGRPAATSQTHPCATCSACCHTYIVPVCGYDVWQISRYLHLDPDRFLVAWQEEEPGVDGFRLERDGSLFSLVLDKRSWTRERSPCVFLMRLPGGLDRCGVYDHRPAACGAYPMVRLGSAITLRDDPLCPPNAWPIDEAAKPPWRDALQRAHMHFDVYRLVAGRWNSRVRDASPETAYDFADYYNYLLRVYDALAVLDGEIGEHELRRVRAGWRSPHPDADSAKTVARVEELPWQAYLGRARGMLERF